MYTYFKMRISFKAFVTRYYKHKYTSQQNVDNTHNPPAISKLANEKINFKDSVAYKILHQYDPSIVKEK